MPIRRIHGAALQRKKRLLRYVQVGMHKRDRWGNTDEQSREAEDVRRRLDDIVEPAPEDPGGDGGAGGGGSVILVPPPPAGIPRIIDRLHKWGRNYVVVSHDHFTGDDPVNAPGYAPNDTATTIADGMAKAVYLADKMTADHERVTLQIWGGVWNEPLIIAHPRIDVVGIGDPLIMNNHEESFIPLVFVLPDPELGMYIRGIRFFDNDQKGAAVISMIQTTKNYPQGALITDCEFLSNGGIPLIGTGALRFDRCLFKQMSPSTSVVHVPAAKINFMPMAKPAWTEFSNCHFYGLMDGSTAKGWSIEITSRTDTDTYPASHEIMHDTGVKITGGSQMFGTVVVDGWSASVEHSFVVSDQIEVGQGFLLRGAGAGGSVGDEGERPANLTVNHTPVRAQFLAHFQDMRLMPIGVVGRARFKYVSHEIDITTSAGGNACSGTATGHVSVAHCHTPHANWVGGTAILIEDVASSTNVTEFGIAENPFPKDIW